MVLTHHSILNESRLAAHRIEKWLVTCKLIIIECRRFSLNIYHIQVVNAIDLLIDDRLHIDEA